MPNPSPLRVIGLMSGTSLDGIDAALIETDGHSIHAFGPALTLPYPAHFRTALRQLITDIAANPAQPPPNLPAIEAELTQRHAEAVRALGQPAHLIGFHGQTVLHAPAQRRTWQIGNAASLATLTNLPVACDFRLNDVSHGGQGAPLVPIYHAALAEKLEKPVLVVNIGGVANLTWIGPNAQLLACDTGPGCALLDDFMASRTGTAIDQDGTHALAGTPNEPLLAQFLAHPFFRQPAPKSLDRQHFAATLPHLTNLSTPDGAATLAAFTARAIALAPLPAPPKRVLITGGGRHNRAIMAALAACFSAPVAPVESVGWNGDALEAQCFAYLAARVKHGLPLTFPATTGAPHPLPGGRLIS